MLRLPLATLAIIAALGCGGDSRPSADTTGAPAATPPAPGGTAAPSSGTAAQQPATGKTWDVRMVGDGTSYRFEPSSITIKVGDAIRWTIVSGPPHNVSFWADSIPANAATQLGANMENVMSPLTGPLLNGLNETYTISFAGVPTGLYKYYCTPHLAMGMVASITIQ